MLAFDVLDLGLNVYRDLADCTIEAPTLEENVRKFSELSSKLKFEKDMVNLDWVKGLLFCSSRSVTLNCYTSNLLFFKFQKVLQYLSFDSLTMFDTVFQKQTTNTKK